MCIAFKFLINYSCFILGLALPYSEFEKNENTVLITTTRGGHFGFMEGISPFGKTWMNRAVRQSLSAIKHMVSIK